MKILAILVCVLMLFSLASAESYDNDGVCQWTWQHNNTGNPLSYFQIRYHVIPFGATTDTTFDVTTTALTDSSLVLLSPGDFGWAEAWAVSTQGEFSTPFITDSIYFYTDTGIDPITGGAWIDN